MDIKHYIAESEKQYHLRLKTLVPLDDDAMDAIEMTVAKYQPLSIARPYKTIMQRQPLDFPNVEAAEVYILDMDFGLPIAPHVVRADIRKALDAPESHVFVRNRNEPGELQTQVLNAVNDLDAEAIKRGLVHVPLLDDPSYSEVEIEHDDMYGDDYNNALVSYLTKIEQERRVNTVKVYTPFRWLDLPDSLALPGGEVDVVLSPEQSKANFNADVADAPYVKPPRKDIFVDYSIFGNFDSENETVRRVYQDENGKRIVLTRKLKGEE